MQAKQAAMLFKDRFDAFGQKNFGERKAFTTGTAWGHDTLPVYPHVVKPSYIPDSTRVACTEASTALVLPGLAAFAMRKVHASSTIGLLGR
ncbi:hypothetical protein [Neorhodopirellula pilleata]|uniref:Uncharacterized protein n=1 Tax=Neorhodopirellula pilleata TaxID=2714738 RepID=A0A5C5ZHM3_9BACT|nr:hypothetical protein [Neorhodopirellula pilleata]TWT86381.1 hypothetical protein Pla100_60880 [Neorhodopirellula pilleata]